MQLRIAAYGLLLLLLLLLEETVSFEEHFRYSEIRGGMMVVSVKYSLECISIAKTSPPTTPFHIKNRSVFYIFNHHQLGNNFVNISACYCFSCYNSEEDVKRTRKQLITTYVMLEAGVLFSSFSYTAHTDTVVRVMGLCNRWMEGQDALFKDVSTSHIT